MSETVSKVETDREILQEAQAKGAGATLGAWVRLSGPGWLQSAITLGGGSLSGALFMGILGGYSLLWLQLVAIICGVVMLSAISYVTLSTGKRPFRQINAHINPVLGWGWIVATVAANMIFLMPQFGLCYAALNKNLAPGLVGDSMPAKATVSLLLLVAGGLLVYMNSRPGLATKIFDVLLKAMIGVIVICFFGVVIKLGMSGEAFTWSEVFGGFIPDFSAATEPTGQVAEIAAEVQEPYRDFWTNRIVADQRAAMIGAAATAVGINMTFLLPYSMLARGWDKTFRGLARFDLSTGMAIPYILVTSCVVIASAAAFHAKVDADFLSTSPETMAKSPIYGGAEKTLALRVVQYEKEGLEVPQEYLDEATGEDGNVDDAKLTGILLAAKYEPLKQAVAELPEDEKKLAASLVKRSEFLLSESLAPLLGGDLARWVFGIGIFGMGFSTIIILMMINGYAFTEMLNTKPNGAAHVIGCLVAGLSGASWFIIWDGPAKTWLAILVSSFAVMFLPIAYVTFFMMMNSKKILGDDKPKGLSWIIWNVLMIISVVGAIAAAVVSITDKVTNPGTPFAQKAVVLTVVIGYLILFVGGFFLRSGKDDDEPVDAAATETA
ncbi:Natural resistance-associated macrophage protein [Bremerella volcania]|uniref:Natural resistance-associated macrophage protein n=1 Tax=Bremerella volcania TaxID=2527984 RepID=A0A518CDG2_9BACT|nr:divalent metal cation transporter [Bremerella volcania]QDU77269.1 Natural resistance-associated macrophage protein [Bremerella volcania]